MRSNDGRYHSLRVRVPGTDYKIRARNGRIERDSAAVRNDVLEEFITAASARDDYGVVLRDDLTLDEAATTALRHIVPVRTSSRRKASNAFSACRARFTA